MILGAPSGSAGADSQSGRVTLDDLFRRAFARHPGVLALADTPNRESFTDHAPRRLTYAEADRVISAIAGRLRRMGLPTDAVVGMQLPNTVEHVLTLLGVLRAGMIAAPIPLLWRRADAVTALSRLGAKVLVTSSHVGDVDHGDLAIHVAAEIFPIRYVCAFGSNIPDGVVPFDDLYTIDELDPVQPIEREHAGNPAAHVAVITWDVGPDGLIPVARNQAELIIGGLAVVLEGHIEQDARILSSIMLSSFAGLASTLIPWLLAGGTLLLHQPFSPDVFVAQREEHQCQTLVVAGPLTARLADAGMLRSGDGLNTVVALWRSPERVASSGAWREPAISLIDLHVFGETGLLGARRDSNGKRVTIPFGQITAPRDTPGAILVAEIGLTGIGTVAMRGPMVPRFPFPPDAERGTLPYLQIGDKGYVDTGYTVRIERDLKTMVVTGPPLGIVGVGGYRFALRELHDLVARADVNGTNGAVPDPLTGQKLSGSATDQQVVQKVLTEFGVNPLVIAAFRGRRGETASAA
jgi:non-ribosomal peptide synthetase component E (peptide arylation enzyme)